MNEIATHFDYSELNYPVRQDMPDAFRLVWDQIANAGNWWRGQDRVDIAAEVRAAHTCDLCQQRKSSLSPFTVTGAHDSVSDLPDVAIDAVHRLVTDPSRLTASWLSACHDEGLSVEQYIELLGIVVAVISIDGFHRAIGVSPEPLPAPCVGEPNQYRPASARDGDAWVPRIPAKLAIGDEADLYDGNSQAANVITAMSLVPNSVRLLKSLSAVQYLKMSDVVNPARNGNRKISRAQMELLAGRVSALSDCFY